MTNVILLSIGLVAYIMPKSTGVALAIEVDDKMPQHEYYEYFGPDYTLHVAPSNMENKNLRHLLDDIRSKLVDYLSKLQHAPSVQFQERPPNSDLGEGNLLCKMLINHWQKFTFNPSGGLRLKRDITEYGEFVRSFNASSVDEKFELLGIVANVFIVAPESLSSLFEGTPSIRKDAQRFIQLREDYKSAKLATKFSSLWPSSS